MSNPSKQMENEIASLAYSIKHTVISPTEKQMEELFERISAIESSLLFLNKAYFAAAMIFAITIGTLFYYILG